jgi:hypothetical protein
MRTRTLLPLLGLLACAAPGERLVPLPTDFAYFEVQLRG